jgi:hypothetical protein
MPEVETYFIDNDNLIKLTGLQDAANNIYLNAASVTVTIVDATTESEISGQTWPTTMTYVSGSNGDYQATLEFDLVVIDTQSLRADIVADAGAGLRLSLRVPVVAAYRQGD